MGYCFMKMRGQSHHALQKRKTHGGEEEVMKMEDLTKEKPDQSDLGSCYMLKTLKSEKTQKTVDRAELWCRK